MFSIKPASHLVHWVPLAKKHDKLEWHCFSLLSLFPHIGYSVSAILRTQGEEISHSGNMKYQEQGDLDSRLVPDASNLYFEKNGFIFNACVPTSMID